MVIGLTGGIATGKSTVSNMFRKLQIPVVDADVIARLVVEPGKEAYEEIVKQFGENILTEEKAIDRKKLGAIVFKDEEKRMMLNRIVHPAIRKEMKRQVNEYKKEGHKTIVMDIPLLFESKLEHMVDKIIVIYTTKETQLKRLMERDKMSKEEALQRINAQLPIDEKKKLADAVIHNEGSIEETKEQLLQLLKKWDILFYE